MIIDKNLLDQLTSKAKENPRLRMHYDLRDSSEDENQRMLNALEVGTKVNIHRHEDTSETVICLQGRLDVIFYADVPNMDVGGPTRDFHETYRMELCPAKGHYGVQIPKGVWHTIEVYEESTIFEAKMGNTLRDRSARWN